MASDPPGDLVLAPVNGKPHSLQEWLTTFHLVFVALDPFTYESAWVLEPAARIFRLYGEADCRVAFLVTGTPEEARQFLGPLVTDVLTFADPERTAVKGFGLERLPALVHVRHDLSVAGVAEGWDPPAWREITDNLSLAMRWTRPMLPAPGDLAPYEGTPAVA